MRASDSARVSAFVVAVVAALIPVLLPSSLGAAGGAPRSADFDLARMQPVNPDNYRSISYANRGRHFFRADGWLCQIGPQPGATACKGKPRTAPPRVIGVAIAGEQQGPYWVRPGTTFQLGPVSPFRAPVLRVGTRLTVADVTCAVPSRGVVVCRNWNRGFKVSRGSHTFMYPRGDRAHDRNPRSRT